MTARTTHRGAGVSTNPWLRRIGALGTAAALALVLAACGGGGDAVSVREQAKELVNPFANVTGAVYTTVAACGTTNTNQFDLKADVYLNGGPAGGGSGLPEGTYYVQVTDPSGATLLGYTTSASVSVGADGKFAECYRLVDILVTNSDGTAGYDTSPNGGGVYKVWVTPELVGGDPKAPYASNRSKTDNFKVDEGACVPGTDGCVPADFGTLVIKKYYDANANGLYDTGEALLEGWLVSTQIGTDAAVDRWTTYSALVNAGSYTVNEYMPIETNWRATDTGPKTAVVVRAQTTEVMFGNLCVGAGGGLTLGFWSNKNGQALVQADDLAMLRGLNLKNGSGADFDPNNNSALRTWLLNGTAVNMAYMLSVQMSAMQLNVYNGKVSGGSIIYAPGTMAANALGYATVAAVMAEANAALGADGYTPDGDANRAYQEALKNALDNANNNRNFVQATACAYTFN